ncbi:YsnF/AvaK domain-containing protein [Devosia submarina]|uniref:YsnF/AvaK domain-containing protein n=1 Tax=Devosia submarina TaxID=1173082 RepID=UPI000D378D0A|nr:YsnF/AvaK domain-containing protein [Devosia submarina]
MSEFTSQRTITAFFDNRADADAAVAELRSIGLSDSAISVTAGPENALAGVPAENQGFFAALANIFMPDEDRSLYAEGLRRGGYIVAVTDAGSNEDAVYDILEERGSIDLDERSNQWRSEGWEVERPLTTSSSGLLDDEMEGTAVLDDTAALDSTVSLDNDLGVRDRVGGESDVIPVVEERLRVGKRDVSHGRVRIRSYVSETPVSEQVTLHSEQVAVDRRPVDRPLTDADAAFEERTIEAVATAEEAVVAKEARVVEEIALRKEESDRVETVTDTVRSQEVEIEDTRIDPLNETER